MSALETHILLDTIPLHERTANLALKHFNQCHVQFTHREHYDTVWKLARGVKVNKQKVQQAINELKKVHYQHRVKKGHKYKFDFVINFIFISVFDSYLQTNQFYNLPDFRSYLTMPVDFHTVPEANITPHIFKICSGKAVEWDEVC